MKFIEKSWEHLFSFLIQQQITAELLPYLVVGFSAIL